MRWIMDFLAGASSYQLLMYGACLVVVDILMAWGFDRATLRMDNSEEQENHV